MVAMPVMSQRFSSTDQTLVLEGQYLSSGRRDEHQEKSRESFKDSKQTTRHEVRRLSSGVGEGFWIFRFERIIEHVRVMIQKGIKFIPNFYSRCQLRAYEHNGRHGLWGLAPPFCPARSAGVKFWEAFSAHCGGGLLLQHVPHDHNEQRPPQTGTPTSRRQCLHSVTGH